jgi:hypothetical protein
VVLTVVVGVGVAVILGCASRQSKAIIYCIIPQYVDIDNEIRFVVFSAQETGGGIRCNGDFL